MARTVIKIGLSSSAHFFVARSFCSRAVPLRTAWSQASLAPRTALEAETPKEKSASFIKQARENT